MLRGIVRSVLFPVHVASAAYCLQTWAFKGSCMAEGSHSFRFIDPGWPDHWGKAAVRIVFSVPSVMIMILLLPTALLMYFLVFWLIGDKVGGALKRVYGWAYGKPLGECPEGADDAE